jgi:uncharacterized Zn finger protein (UPF0148 family)
MGEKMRKPKKCKKCGIEMYQDDHGEWFCPNCSKRSTLTFWMKNKSVGEN